MKTYKIKPLVWMNSFDGTISIANDPSGLRYTATESSVSLYDDGEYMWSSECKSMEEGRRIAEKLRQNQIELNLEDVEVDQGPVEELLREAAATVHASLVETDISDARREYRRGLEQRLLRAGKAKGGQQS